jgi:hypothetical protein
MDKNRKIKIIFLIILSTVIIGFVFPQDKDKNKQPAPPKPVVEPTKPVVPGAQTPSLFPSLPSLPAIPNKNDQTDGKVTVVERYNLTVSGAFPNGNTVNNVASTIKNAEYILFSNRTIDIKLIFTNNLEYIYHLRNPRAKIEIRTGVFRENYETVVQAGKEFLLEQYISELSYDNNTVISLTLIGNNKIIVILNFTKKT